MLQTAAARPVFFCPPASCYPPNHKRAELALAPAADFWQEEEESILHLSLQFGPLLLLSWDCSILLLQVIAKNNPHRSVYSHEETPVSGKLENDPTSGRETEKGEKKEGTTY